jgi:hypothetical protein
MKKKSLRNLLQPVLFTTLLVYLISCGSKKEEDKKAPGDDKNTTINSSGNKESQDAKIATTGASGFYYLKLDSATIWNIFKIANSSKILLQFADSNNTAFSLIAYGAIKKTNIITTGPIGLTIETDTPWDTSGLKILGNLEVTKKEIKLALGLTPGTPLKKENCKDLYFSPTMDVSYPKYILYNISTVKGIKEFLAGSGTKPSPPAPPCDTNCD